MSKEILKNTRTELVVKIVNEPSINILFSEGTADITNDDVNDPQDPIAYSVSEVLLSTSGTVTINRDTSSPQVEYEFPASAVWRNLLGGDATNEEKEIQVQGPASYTLVLTLTKRFV